MTAPRSTPAPRPASCVALGLALALVATAVAAVPFGCALPGRPTPILPEVSGTVAGDLDPGVPARLTLVVIHTLTPSVHDRREVALSSEHAFHFEPLLREVAGREFGRGYRIYLHLTQGEADRVIWRAQISRLEDPNPIALDCDLARPTALGEPCRVRDPLDQAWLLDEGRRHYARLCADCHGRDARGGLVPRPPADSAAPPPAAVAERAPDLTRLAARHGGRFDRDAVVAWIEGRSLAEGHVRGGMPVWGERLSSEFERYADGEELIGATLDPIVAYLESLQGAGPAPTP